MSTYYLDVWITASTKEDAKSLQTWAEDPVFKDKVKCCWFTGHKISEKLNGYGRVIHYFDQYYDGVKPTSAF